MTRKIPIRKVAGLVQEEVKLVVSIFQEKGAKPFGRALLVALALPFAAYALVYAPAVRKLSQLQNELKLARVTAEYADTYKSLNDRLATAYAQLPPFKDRGTWLSDMVQEALRAEGIVATQFMPPLDEETNGMVIQNINVTMPATFAEVMAFAAKLEAATPLVHITTLELNKKQEPIGRNEVNCTISTLFLPERY